MKIDQYFEKLKNTYIQTRPSPKMTAEGWEDLSNILDPRPWTKYFAPRYFLYALSSLILIAGILLGVAKVSQASLPGDLLYPVKRLSEKIITSVTGNNQKKIENRAKEIIDLKKRGDEDAIRLQQAVQEYEQTVQERDREIKEDKNSGQNNEERQGKQKEQEGQRNEIQNGDDENKGEGSQGEVDNSSGQSEDQNEGDLENRED